MLVKYISSVHQARNGSELSEHAYRDVQSMGLILSLKRSYLSNLGNLSLRSLALRVYKLNMYSKTGMIILSTASTIICVDP